MKTIHILDGKQLEKESNDPSFLLTNKQGGFCWFNAEKTKSRYEGVFFTEKNRIFKVIESLENKNNPELMINKFYKIKKIGKNTKETFFMPNFFNSFVYETDLETEIFLDFREAYNDDYATYETEKINSGMLIKIYYRNEIFYLVIRFEGIFKEENRFLEKLYQYDQKRNSNPFKRNTFLLGKINSKKIVFSFSSEKNKAINEANNVFNNADALKDKKSSYIKKIISKNKNLPEEYSVAYNSCRLSLDSLSLENGLFAGLPWFFQFWARDELISLQALFRVNPNLAEKIFTRWLSSLKEKEWKTSSKLNLNCNLEGNSIDAVGWLIKRSISLKRENDKKLKLFLNSLSPEMLYNNNGETWMDSLSREGFRIEMQAMKLYALKISNQKDKEEKLKNETRKSFWDTKNLYDSNYEKLIRPNIFIAYYFYPELLLKQEWETCFENSLKALWCDWGGLSTIDKQNPEFHAEHSGEFGKSYHNGDSWFWINNLTALALADLNKDKFKPYIKSILEASTFDILYQGAIANHSEISSASSLKSEGCISQAFSASMYIELIEKLIEKGFEF